jgi:TonB family protein
VRIGECPSGEGGFQRAAFGQAVFDSPVGLRAPRKRRVDYRSRGVLLFIVLPLVSLLAAVFSAAASSETGEGFDASTIPESEWESPFTLEHLGGGALSGEIPEPEPIQQQEARFSGTEPASALSVRPKCRMYLMAPYPAIMRGRRIGGEAVIGYVVERDGSVRQAKIISATHRLFGEAARDTVLRWTYTPGRDAKGKTKAAILVCRIEFKSFGGPMYYAAGGAPKDVPAARYTPAVLAASSKTFNAFFGADLVHLETTSGCSEMQRYFQDRTYAELKAEFLEKESANKDTLRVAISEFGPGDRKTLAVAAYVVVRQNGVLFEVDRFLSFNFLESGRLQTVKWGQPLERMLSDAGSDKATAAPKGKAPDSVPPP